VKDDTHIHIARIESGRANIKLSTLKTLSDYYDVPIPRLFEDIG